MKRNLIFLFLAVGVGTAIGLFLYMEYQRSSTLRMARKHISKGKWSEALGLVQPINEAHPRNLEAALVAARAWRGLGDLDSALSVLSPFVPPNGHNPQAIELVGWLRLDAGQPDEAAGLFAELRHEEEWEAQALVGRAAVKVAQSAEYSDRLLSEARHEINQALAQDPTLGEAYLVLGEIALIERDLAGASRSAMEAIRLLENPARGFLLRGRVRLTEGDYRQAESDIQTALTMGAPDIPAQRQLALVRYYDERIGEAIGLLERIAETDTPESARAARNLASLYALCGLQDRSAEALASVVTAFDSPIVRFQLYAYLVASGRYEEADQILDDLVERFSFFTPGLLEAAAQAWAHNDVTTAKMHVLSAYEVEPDNVWTGIHLGTLALLDEDAQQALDYLEAVRGQPGYFPLGALNTAVAYLMLQRQQDAREVLDDSRLVADSRTRTLATVSLQHSGRLKEALQGFEPADTSLDRFLYGNLLLRAYRFADVDRYLTEHLTPQYKGYFLLKATLAAARGRQSEAALYLRDSSEMTRPYDQWKQLIEAYNLAVAGETESAAQPLNQLVSTNSIASDSARAIAKRFGIALDDPPGRFGEQSDSGGGRVPFTAFESALALERRGRTDEAMQEYRLLLDRIASFAPAIDRLGYLYWTQGEPRPARQQYQRLFDLGLDTKPLRRNVANLAWQGGDRAAAEQLFSGASSDELKIDHLLFELRVGRMDRARGIVATLSDEPTPASRAARGHLAACEGDWETAERLLGRASDDRPSDPWVRINHGVALVHLSRYPEAEESLREAVEIAPNLPDAHRLLGQLYADQGLYREAYFSFSNSLQADPDQPEVERLMDRIDAWLQQAGA